MKKFLLTLFLIGGLFFSPKAANYLASNLSYTCLGGNTYLITYTYYNHCDGVTPPSTQAFSCTCSSNSAFNFNGTLTLMSGSGVDVTPVCGCDSNACHGGTSIGVREYIYQATVTLVPCNSWSIKVDGCCRKSVNTVLGTSNPYFIEATLDNLHAPCNNGPLFSVKPFAYPCIGKNFCLAQGANDPDGDSLVFSFVVPKKSNSLQIIYQAPYADSNFIPSSTPITLAPTTGEICFTPNTIIKTITGIKIDQYRTINGVVTLVGTTYRDMYFRVLTCFNHDPELSGIDTLKTHTYNLADTIHYINWPFGKVVDFDINGFDMDTFNSTCTAAHPERFSISWNNAITGASFIPHNNGTDSAYAHFQWYPTYSSVPGSPHCFIATIVDEGCPYAGQRSVKYCLTITSAAGVNSQEDKNDFQVFPNPNSGIFEIDYNTSSSEKCQLQIFNAVGKEVYHEQWSRPDLSSKHQLNLKNLADGLYYINIRQANRNRKAKIVIKK